jgi:hypothetical protein
MDNDDQKRNPTPMRTLPLMHASVALAAMSFLGGPVSMQTTPALAPKRDIPPLYPSIQPNIAPPSRRIPDRKHPYGKLWKELDRDAKRARRKAARKNTRANRKRRGFR